jgi:hypothetical protein
MCNCGKAGTPAEEMMVAHRARTSPPLPAALVDR